MISTRCVARDLHMIVPGPLEQKCWRRFAAQWGDCKKISNYAIQCDYYYHYELHKCRPVYYSSSWRLKATRSGPLGRWMRSSSPAPACSCRVWSCGECWQASSLETRLLFDFVFHLFFRLPLFLPPGVVPHRMVFASLSWRVETRTKYPKVGQCLFVRLFALVYEGLKSVHLIYKTQSTDQSSL